MNANIKTPTVNVGATTPTVGAVIGGALGTLLNAKLGTLADPVLGGSIASFCSGLFAALFHWAHSKLGTPE